MQSHYTRLIVRYNDGLEGLQRAWLNQLVLRVLSSHDQDAQSDKYDGRLAPLFLPKHDINCERIFALQNFSHRLFS